MRDSFFPSVHTESVCFLLSLVRHRESHCLLPENPPPAQGGLWGGRGSFLQPCPAAPSSLSSMPVVPSLCSSWASLGPALGQHCLRQGAPSARPAPALACSSCSPGPSWVPPPPGGLPLAFSPWPLIGEQPGPH